MAIIIKKQETFIPIVVGDIELKFHYSDESMIDVRKKLIKTQKELNEMEYDKEDDKEIEETRKILNKGMDNIFGEGSFDKIYAMTPSVIIILDYFRQMVEGVMQELNTKGLGFDEDAIAKEYLTKE